MTLRGLLKMFRDADLKRRAGLTSAEIKEVPYHAPRDTTEFTEFAPVLATADEWYHTMISGKVERCGRMIFALQPRKLTS